jgi:hypothetical protein
LTPNFGIARRNELPLTGNTSLVSFSTSDTIVTDLISGSIGNETTALVSRPWVSFNRTINPSPFISAGFIRLHITLPVAPSSHSSMSL